MPVVAVRMMLYAYLLTALAIKWPLEVTPAWAASRLFALMTYRNRNWRVVLSHRLTKRRALVRRRAYKRGHCAWGL